MVLNKSPDDRTVVGGGGGVGVYARIEWMGLLLNLEHLGRGFIKHIILHKMYLSCHPEKLYLMFPMSGRWIKDLSLRKNYNILCQFVF